MIKKFKNLLLIIITISCFGVFSNFILVKANVITSDLSAHLNQAGHISGPYNASTNETSMSRTAGIVVKTFLSLLGVIFMLLVIYGGFTYMNARGEEEKVNKGLAIIRYAIIGLIIITLSYAIWSLIIENYLTA